MNPLVRSFVDGRASRNDACGDADRESSRRHVLRHDGVRTDASSVTDRNRSENFGAGEYPDVLAERREDELDDVALSDRHAMIERAPATDDRAPSDHQPHAVKYTHAGSDLGHVIEIDTVQDLHNAREEHGDQRYFSQRQRSCDPITDKGMEAAIHHARTFRPLKHGEIGGYVGEQRHGTYWEDGGKTVRTSRDFRFDASSFNTTFRLTNKEEFMCPTGGR